MPSSMDREERPTWKLVAFISKLVLPGLAPYFEKIPKENTPISTHVVKGRGHYLVMVSTCECDLRNPKQPHLGHHAPPRNNIRLAFCSSLSF